MRSNLRCLQYGNLGASDQRWFFCSRPVAGCRGRAASQPRGLALLAGGLQVTKLQGLKFQT